jgi:pimeloyl-ACP methyl ester carboxylesterase
LCLHGYPDTAWTWRYLGPALAAQGYRVVAPFARGYAPTEIPIDGDYHIGALMYDAIAIHRELGAGSDAVLIGHDWGGFTAAALAAHPDSPFARIAVLAAPLMNGFQRRFNMSMLRALPSQVRKSWYVLFHQLPGFPERTLEHVAPKLWRDWSPPGYDSTDDVQHVFAALPDARHRKAAIDYYRCQFQPRRQRPQYESLHRAWRAQPYRTPMLVLHGQGDGALDYRLARFTVTSLPPSSRHEIIATAGHFIHLDDPQTVSKMILEYIKEPDR